MKFFNLFLAIVFFLILSHNSYAQHHATEEKHDATHFKTSLVLGYTYLPTTTSKGRETVVLPSIGFDIEYWFSSSFSLGLHNDIELLVFEVENEGSMIVEREFPLLITLDAIWKPFPHWVFYMGPGAEIETNENFFVVRAGVEYELETPHHWEFFPTFFYDIRHDAYNTFTVGFGIGKRF